MENLDKRSVAVFNYINHTTKDGSYQVLTVEDINSALPKKLQGNKAQIKESIDLLSRNNLVKLKYSDMDEYCVTSLAPKKSFDKGDKQEIMFVRKKPKTKREAFFWGLLGGAISGTVIMFIQIIIQFFTELF